MYRMYKYRLYPNATQTVALEQCLETHRHLWNCALAERKDAWEMEKQSVSFGEQYKTFAAIRNAQIAAETAGEEGPHWLAHIAAVSMRDTLKRLDKAFQAFFRRIKANEKPGYPRFRGRHRYDSIPFDNYGYKNGCGVVGIDGYRVLGEQSDDAPKNGFRLRLFGVGSVRVRLHRPIKGKIKTACVKREADRWFVVFACDVGDAQVEPNSNPPVGIDVGLAAFATLSTGEAVANPRFLKKELPELRRQQRAVSRKYKVGKKKVDQSKRWRKALKRVARLHAKVRDHRKEHHHKTSLNLVRRFGLIALEDLNIHGLLRGRRLARAISDAAWGGFVATLTCKGENAGVKVVKVDARGTSQTCVCGAAVPKELRDRWHSCKACGLEAPRDEVSARVILARGLEQGRAGPARHNGAVRRRAARSPAARRALAPTKDGPLATGHAEA